MRFGRDKLVQPLGGRSVLLRSVQAFVSRADVALLMIATNAQAPAWLESDSGARDWVRSGRLRMCAGGETRAQSVRNAVLAVPPEIEWVAVHDAARPLVSSDLIDRTFEAAREHGAAVPAMPIALTVKQAKGPLPARVERTVPRESLWVMQTPQVMRRAALLAAFDSCPLPLDQVTDDVQLLELAGHEVWLIPGEERNLKITTATDLQIAEMILAKT